MTILESFTLKGSSGSGKTRLLQEVHTNYHCITSASFISIRTGICRSPFQKELIRQLLCLPALDKKTEDVSAQILDEILTRSDVHVTKTLSKSLICYSAGKESRWNLRLICSYNA